MLTVLRRGEAHGGDIRTALRERKFVQVAPTGRAALEATQTRLRRMSEGLEWA